MSRTARFLWPAGVLLVSFLLLWGLTRCSSTEKAADCAPTTSGGSPSTAPSTPPFIAGQGLSVTVTGVFVPDGSDQPKEACSLVPGLLVLETGPKLCLAPDLAAADWMLVDAVGKQSRCLLVHPGQDLTVRLVHP